MSWRKTSSHAPGVMFTARPADSASARAAASPGAGGGSGFRAARAPPPRRCARARPAPFHDGVHGRELRHGRRPAGHHAAQTCAQVGNAGLHGLLQRKIPLAINRVVDRRLRGAGRRHRAVACVAVRPARRAIFSAMALARAGTHAGAFLFRRAIGFVGRRGRGGRVAVQHRGQGDRVRPAQPEAEPVRQGLPGFGNLNVRKTGKQADQGRSAQACAPGCWVHTAESKIRQFTRHLNGGAAWLSSPVSGGDAPTPRHPSAPVLRSRPLP